MPLSTHTNALALNFCFLITLTLNFFHYFELKVYPNFMLYTLSMPVFLNHRDADVFLPGLELFLKLKKSLNSTLIRYQLFTLVNKNYWKCISSKAYTPWYYVAEKHYLKHIQLGQKLAKNCDRDSEVKICLQPGLSRYRVPMSCDAWCVLWCVVWVEGVGS